MCVVMPPSPSCVCARARWWVLGWVVESPSTHRVVSVYSGFVSRSLRARPERVHVTRLSTLRGGAQSAATYAEAVLSPSSCRRTCPAE